jgi:hypothetical protein
MSSIDHSKKCATSPTRAAAENAAVVVAGFYMFTRMVEGKATPAPSRFTMLITKRRDEWRIADHHSSPLVLPKS